MPPEAIKIRRAATRDIQTLADFNIAMAQETEDRSLDPETVQSGVSSVIDSSARGFYLIAESGDTCIGALLITFEWSDWRNGDLWWIQSVYVLPTHRQKGVFRQLYEAVVSQATAHGDVRGIRLYVEKDNLKAQRVYEHLKMTRTPYQIYERMF
ncbi:MAG: GNAT family N-acetyltransferase [Gammaproteobacteria bacterium]